MDPSTVLETFTKPTKWCESYLKNPMDSDYSLNLKSYQREITDNTRNYKNIILQWGRRLGKSVIMCADCLWWTTAYPLVRMVEGETNKQKPFKVVIFTPYESQIKELWLTFNQLIGDSPLLKEQILKQKTSDVHEIQFKNGSIIQGYTVGISSSNRGTSLRGLSADLIYMDEMDFIPREIVETVIIPITTTHKNCRRRICSTPSGARDLYFEYCMKAKQLGWFHTHHPSWHPDNDRWLSIKQAREQGIPIEESSEFQVRAITSSDAFDREYGAEFGEAFGGVYKHHFINRSLSKYGRNIDTADPDIFDPGFQQKPEHKYIIGVDWNTYVNGGQIVILEFCTTPTIVEFFDDDKKEDKRIDFTGHYRLFYRRGIKSKEATQRLTRQEIIRLLTHYKIDYVYVDYGAGDTNIEELTLYGRLHPELGLSKKLRVIDSGATVEHYDHVVQKKVKKRNKSLMINFSVLNLEEGLFILPFEEDQKTRLIGQMREYRVKNITARGEPAYEGEDHILDAFNLAVYGFEQNYGSILRSNIKYNLTMAMDPRREFFPRREQQEINESYERTDIRGIVDPEKISDYNKRPKRRENFGPVGIRIRGKSFSRKSFIPGNVSSRGKAF